MANDVFPLVVALLPLATYFLLLGGMRLFHPLVTTGVRDGMALAIGVSGFVIMGPMHLFFPTEAAAALGWTVWLVLLVLYALCVVLVLLSLRPKIIIYGLRLPEVLDPLLEACKTIDPSATLDVSSQQILLNERGVRLRVDLLGMSDTVQIEAFEQNLHPKFWYHLLLQLRSRIKKGNSGFSGGALGMLGAGLALISFVIFQALTQPSELLAGFRQWLEM